MWKITYLSIKSFIQENKKVITKIIVALITIVVALIIAWPIIRYIRNFNVDDWAVVAAIGQVIGALATAAAVFVALKPKKPKIDIDFKMLDSNDEDQFVAKIHIFNISESIAILHELKISLDKIPDSDLVSESYNSLKNDFRDYRDPISILPYQRDVIEISPDGMLWGIGHMLDAPSEETKDKLIKITIVVNEKKFVFKTKYTYQEYYDAFTGNI